MGKEEAVDDGESSESEQAVVFWARISLQLWKDEEKQYVCLFPDVPYRTGSLCLLLLEAFPHPCEALYFRKYKSAALPCPVPLFSMLKC